MGLKCSLAVFIVFVSVLVALVGILVYFSLTSVGSIQKYEDGWWGKGQRDTEPKDEDISIHELKIAIPDSVLDDLKQRLSKTRFFDTLEGIEWEYGTNQDYMRNIVDYWSTNYEWKKHEGILNSVQNYITLIEGIKVHYWHFKPEPEKGKKIVPIMFIHGWPGSYFEFYKVIEILKSGSGDYAFEVICPSIPGYGFSEAPHKPGFNAIDAARMFSKLMARLGHSSYYIHGGHWGSVIGRMTAVVYSSHVRGLHLTFFNVLGPHGPLSYIMAYMTLPPKEHKKIFPLMDYLSYGLRESGYVHLQATRPDTVGLGLNDSPAGLASYIIEKFSVWSGCPTNGSSTCLESRFTKDELLTNVMIYWVTNSITSSMRFYKENFGSKDVRKHNRIPIKVPTALAAFPHEISFLRPPKPWVSYTYVNVVQYTEMPRGGHFAALEEPELVAKDVIKFLKKVEAMAASKERSSTV